MVMKESKIELYSHEYWELKYKERCRRDEFDNFQQYIGKILENSYLTEPGRIALIGCTNIYDAIKFAKQNFLVTVIESSESAIQHIKKKMQKIKVNIDTIFTNLFELPGKLLHKFDYLIICNICSEIASEDRVEFLYNLQQLIKPGGLLIVIFDMDGELCEEVLEKEIIKIAEHLSDRLYILNKENLDFKSQDVSNRKMIVIWKKYNY